ncbi:MAG: hypothetical protein GC203_02735 [Phenylobacterium sp.]|uniref:hypothetical protein n=1 Tax=Phenylobacterium sp. TaxID=1871053 RepID=UPI0025CD251A|nr:hypothetical protein [Phenylobacterium sp.]MBI1196757.1 hypothetical protein [Phenylobacterium sp.]
MRTLLMGTRQNSDNGVVLSSIIMSSAADNYTVMGPYGVTAWLKAGSGTWDLPRTITYSFGSQLGVAAVAQAGAAPTHITTNTTTTAKSGAGVWANVCINKTGSAEAPTVYDNTAASGTVLAVINDAGAEGCREYNLSFAIGLTIVSAGTTAGDHTFGTR